MYILFTILVICTICMCLPVPIGDWYFGYFGLCMFPHVVESHMLEHIVNMVWAHEDMLPHKGGVCDTHEDFRDFHCFRSYRSV